MSQLAKPAGNEQRSSSQRINKVDSRETRPKPLKESSGNVIKPVTAKPSPSKIRIMLPWPVQLSSPDAKTDYARGVIKAPKSPLARSISSSKMTGVQLSSPDAKSDYARGVIKALKSPLARSISSTGTSKLTGIRFVRVAGNIGGRCDMEGKLRLKLKKDPKAVSPRSSTSFDPDAMATDSDMHLSKEARMCKDLIRKKDKINARMDKTIENWCKHNRCDVEERVYTESNMNLSPDTGHFPVGFGFFVTPECMYTKEREPELSHVYDVIMTLEDEETKDGLLCFLDDYKMKRIILKNADRKHSRLLAQLQECFRSTRASLDNMKSSFLESVMDTEVSVRRCYRYTGQCLHKMAFINKMIGYAMRMGMKRQYTVPPRKAEAGGPASQALLKHRQSVAFGDDTDEGDSNKEEEQHYRNKSKSKRRSVRIDDSFQDDDEEEEEEDQEEDETKAGRKKRRQSYRDDSIDDPDETKAARTKRRQSYRVDDSHMPDEDHDETKAARTKRRQSCRADDDARRRKSMDAKRRRWSEGQRRSKVTMINLMLQLGLELEAETLEEPHIQAIQEMFSILEGHKTDETSLQVNMLEVSLVWLVKLMMLEASSIAQVKDNISKKRQAIKEMQDERFKDRKLYERLTLRKKKLEEDEQNSRSQSAADLAGHKPVTRQMSCELRRFHGATQTDMEELRSMPLVSYKSMNFEEWISFQSRQQATARRGSSSISVGRLIDDVKRMRSNSDTTIGISPRHVLFTGTGAPLPDLSKSPSKRAKNKDSSTESVESDADHHRKKRQRKASANERKISLNERIDSDSSKKSSISEAPSDLVNPLDGSVSAYTRVYNRDYQATSQSSSDHLKVTVTPSGSQLLDYAKPKKALSLEKKVVRKKQIRPRKMVEDGNPVSEEDPEDMLKMLRTFLNSSVDHLENLHSSLNGMKMRAKYDMERIQERERKVMAVMKGIDPVLAKLDAQLKTFPRFIYSDDCVTMQNQTHAHHKCRFCSCNIFPEGEEIIIETHEKARALGKMLTHCNRYTKVLVGVKENYNHIRKLLIDTHETLRKGLNELLWVEGQQGSATFLMDEEWERELKTKLAEIIDFPSSDVELALEKARKLSTSVALLTSGTMNVIRDTGTRMTDMKDQDALLNHMDSEFDKVQQILQTSALQVARLRCRDSYLHASRIMLSCKCPYCKCFNPPFVHGLVDLSRARSRKDQQKHGLMQVFSLLKQGVNAVQAGVKRGSRNDMVTIVSGVNPEVLKKANDASTLVKAALDRLLEVKTTGLQLSAKRKPKLSQTSLATTGQSILGPRMIEFKEQAASPTPGPEMEASGSRDKPAVSIDESGTLKLATSTSSSVNLVGKRSSQVLRYFRTDVAQIMSSSSVVNLASPEKADIPNTSQPSSPAASYSSSLNKLMASMSLSYMTGTTDGSRGVSSFQPIRSVHATSPDSERDRRKSEMPDMHTKMSEILEPAKRRSEVLEPRKKSHEGRKKSEPSEGRKKSGSSEGRKKSEPSVGKKKSESSEGKKKSESSEGRKKSEPSEGRKKSEPSVGRKKSEPSEGRKKSEPSVGKKKSESSEGRKKSEPSVGRKKSEPSEGRKKSEPSVGKKKSEPSVGKKKSEYS